MYVHFCGVLKKKKTLAEIRAHAVCCDIAQGTRANDGIIDACSLDNGARDDGHRLARMIGDEEEAR